MPPFVELDAIAFVDYQADAGRRQLDGKFTRDAVVFLSEIAFFGVVVAPLGEADLNAGVGLDADAVFIFREVERAESFGVDNKFSFPV